MSDEQSPIAVWIGAEFDGGKLRLWLVDSSGEVVEASEHDAAGDPDVVLAGQMQERGLTALPVLRSGWPDARLIAVPAKPDLAGDPLPGLSQAPPDLMRADAVRIAGLLSIAPNFDGVICLVGAQTVWAQLSAGEVVSFRSFLTSDLIAALSPGLPASTQLDPQALTAAVDHVMSRPAGLAGDLASLRADAVLNGLAGDTAQARLSGLLIGAELAAAKPYWLGQQVVLAGSGDLADAYAAALAAQGLTPRRADAEALSLAGLTAAWRARKKG